MNKLDLFLIGVIIGCVAVLVIFMSENKRINKEIIKLREENVYYKWQLNEVPSIIESNKEVICK